jgi:hypothetical protein
MAEEDTIVVLRYNDVGRARRALQELKRLDGDGRLQVSAAALVGRPEGGGSGAPTGSGYAEGYYVPKKGIVGILVDALSGPAEASYAEPTETFRGHGAEPGHEAEREHFLGEVSKTLEPGVTIVIAEITDPDPGVLDAALKGLGGSVTRRAASDVYAELEALSGAPSGGPPRTSGPGGARPAAPPRPKR